MFSTVNNALGQASGITGPNNTYYTYSSTDGTSFTVSAIMSDTDIYSYDSETGYSESPAEPGLPGYAKRQPITINSASALTDYQVKLTIAYDSDMQPDFDDLRFTSADGTTELSYWLESKTDSTTAIVWVKVPSLVSGDNTLYMYYANASVTTASNGDNTFDFFDDFLGSSIDVAKWIVTGSPTVSDSIVSITVNENNYKTIISQNSFGTGTSIRSRIKSGHYTSNGEQYERYYTLFQNGTNYIHTIFTHSLSTWQGKYTQSNGTDNATPIQGWTANTWKIIEGKRSATSITWTVNDSNTVVHSANYPTTSGQCGVGVYGMGNYATMSMDWVVVRKYVATEPTSSFGAEQNN